MNMTNFPVEVWVLHRKLFHRFVKYHKYISKETKNIAGYYLTTTKDKVQPAEPTIPPSPPKGNSQHVVCLLSSSEGEVSEDGDSTTEEEGAEDEGQEDDSDGVTNV